MRRCPGPQWEWVEQEGRRLLWSEAWREDATAGWGESSFMFCANGTLLNLIWSGFRAVVAGHWSPAAPAPGRRRCYSYRDLFIGSIRKETSPGLILCLAGCTDLGKVELPALRGVGLESELLPYPSPRFLGCSCTKHSGDIAGRQWYCSVAISVLGMFPPFS